MDGFDFPVPYFSGENSSMFSQATSPMSIISNPSVFAILKTLVVSKISQKTGTASHKLAGLLLIDNREEAA